MNSKLSIEKTPLGNLLCTLDFPDLNGSQSMRLTLQLHQGPERTISQVELEVMKRAQELLSEMCSKHPANRRQPD